MVDSKQKPVPEGVKRNPGKSKFSIPRREAPPIDGSYLDRLFADYNKQTKELEVGSDAAENSQAENFQQSAIVEHRQTGTPEETPPAALAAEALPQPPIPHPIPFPVDATEEIPAGTELKSPASQSGTLRHVGRKPVIKTPAQRTPAPSAPFPVDDPELVQKLVKVHRLSKGEESILSLMIRMCLEDGSDVCYIKIPHLVTVTGLKDRQTQRVLKSLSELNLIERLAEYSNVDRLGIKYRVIFFQS